MVKSFVVYTHLLLTCLALGTVIYADWCLFRERNKVISQSVRWLLQEMRFFFVYLLVGLWVSGIAIVALGYSEQGIHYLQNQKLQAKVILMVILTLNAIFLHKVIFPRLDQIQSLADLPPRQLLSLLSAGAISSGSWSFIAYLGVARFMNHTFSISAVLILYVAWISLLFLGSSILFLMPRIQFLASGRLRLVPENYEVLVENQSVEKENVAEVVDINKREKKRGLIANHSASKHAARKTKALFTG